MRKVNGVIDLRSVAPETMNKYAKVMQLKERDPELPHKEHCRRVGLSLNYFWQINKALRIASSGGNFGAAHALG
jgi:hypothetical protein